MNIKSSNEGSTFNQIIDKYYATPIKLELEKPIALFEPIQSKSIIEYAKDLVDRGWKIFPCMPKSKVPACKWKQESGFDLTPWGENPNYNIGVPCAINGLLIIDIDDTDEWREFTEQYGKLDYCLTVKTVKGWHLYYLAANEAYRGKLGDSIDLKFNGYVLGPGSIHPDGGKYDLRLSNDLMYLPDSWEKLCQQKEKPKLEVGEARFDIVRVYEKVIGKQVEDWKAKEVWAKCPFHKNGEEKTPSFCMTLDLGVWYCFACQEGGGAHQLLGKLKGMALPLSGIDYVLVDEELREMKVKLVAGSVGKTK